MMKEKKYRLLSQFFMVIVILSSIAFAGCGSKYSITESDEEVTVDEKKEKDDEKHNEDIFNNSESDMLGSIEHEPMKPNRDQDGNIIPFEYLGGEFSLEYSVEAEGNAETIGFLLFLNGTPQPYKVIEDSTEYEYCHTFQMKDVLDKDFSIYFTPVEGKKGETLDLTVVSIYNPSFQPDMKETSSFGWYHKILENSYLLEFYEDAEVVETTEISQLEVWKDVNIFSEKVTEKFLKDDLSKVGWSDVSLETLSNNVYWKMEYDGENIYDNFKITENGMLHITYKMCGAPGVKYKTTFYVNHIPISCESVTSFEATLSKGDVWVLDGNIDLSRLDKMNTFYAISVPMNAQDYDVNAFVYKSASILLYK